MIINGSWFWIAIGALLLYGVMNFVLKIAAENKFDSFAILNISATTVAFLSLANLLLISASAASVKYEIIFSVLNGSFFMLGSVLKISSLKYAPANVIFPLTKIAVPLIVIYSVFLLHEKLDMMQLIGIGLIISVFFLLARRNDEQRFNDTKFKGIVLVIIAAICTSLSVTAGKIAVMYSVNKFIYMFFSYSLVAGLTAVSIKTTHRKFLWRSKKALYIGIIAGVLNFVGYYMVLTAFTTGNLSLVHPILSLSIIIPILLSWLIYKERLSLQKILALVLTIAAINLMRK